MGKTTRKKNAKKRTESSSPLRTRVVLALLLGTASVLFAIALMAYLMDGNWHADRTELASRMGQVNFFAAAFSVGLVGILGSWFAAIALAAASVRLWFGRPVFGISRRNLAIGGVGILLISALFALPGGDIPRERVLFSGIVGAGVVQLLRAMFGGVGATVALLGMVAAFLATIGIPIFAPLVRLAEPLRRLGVAVADAMHRFRDGIADAMTVTPTAEAAKKPKQKAAKDLSDPIVVRTSGESEEEWTGQAAEEVEVAAADPIHVERPPLLEPAVPVAMETPPDNEEIPDDVPVVHLPSAGEPVEAPAPEPEAAESLRDLPQVTAGPYQCPPQNFLELDEEDPAADEKNDALLESAKLLERTLHSFGVKGKVTRVQPGPVVTRFEIEPGPGQKVAPIAGLSDDLALALKARSIRVEAPIPGKAAVGIEVPNAHPKIVRLGSLLEAPEYAQADSKLTIALGRTISGEVFTAALDRMPHVLVAGATGAGKSVCINTIITSIVYRAGPEDVRFVMVDPKMLELMSYSGLPHVIPPIVTQPKEAAKILKWAVGEMEARYRTLAHVGVRSIGDYNERLEREGSTKMPYLVVIVDELADLMLSNQKSEIEDHIARLAQMARAVGIHLVVATQRPSVDVITGVIKANFPSRIAFQVPTRIDSRTILDSIGAERLLGKGDMLYLGVGMSEPVRVHGSYISTEETNDVVEWLKNRNPKPIVAEAEPSPLDDGNDLYPVEREDELFDEAAKILVTHQQGSISLLQRRMKVGYARAARLVDMMEEAGIVGPFTGSKAREMLVPTVAELEIKLAGRQRAPLGGSNG